MNEDLALQIITEAKALGVGVPDGDVVVEAQNLVEDALIARNGGMNGDPVKTILAVYENGLPKKSRMDEMYEQKELSIARIKRERLPIPDSIEGDAVVLPRDISALSDGALRKLHSEFHACLSRANWLVAVEEADELACRQIADYYHAKAVKKAAESADPITGKAKTVSALEAEAAGDETVREWRQKQNGHHVEVKLLKALRDTYLQSCERISRDWTMRSNERDSR
jgi:hypothetical protein